MMTKTRSMVRIAAVGDIHLGGKGFDAPLQILFGQVAEHADVLALCGDLTDRGDPTRPGSWPRRSARYGADRCGAGQPRLRVGARSARSPKILCDAGVHVLDGEAYEVLGRRASPGSRGLPEGSDGGRWGPGARD